MREKNRIVLASASAYRAQQLRSLGLEFEQISPDIDEDSYKREIADPVVLALMLSDAKAEAVRKKFLKNARTKEADFIVIGSDQLVEFNGEILGKPGDKEQAIAQLLKLAGNEHSLITALTVISVSDSELRKAQDAVIETMQMYPLSRLQAERYVAAEKTWDCAGSYKIEGRGIALFESITGEDFTSIVGLPILKLVKFLREFGCEF